MLEPIYKYPIDKKLLNFLHCPTCKSELHRLQLLDIFTQGLICENNHRFFIELQNPIGTETAKCASIIGSTAKDNKRIIKSWLTNFKLRSKLNSQLATMIRRIYEISESNKNITYEYNIFKYCPFCVKPLENFEQSDAWVQGLRCSNAHEFLARTGEGIGFSYRKEHICLVEEMSNTTLLILLKNWLKEKISSALRNQLHSQIKEIMISFLTRIESESGKNSVRTQQLLIDE